MATLINTLMTALSTIVMPVQEEQLSGEILLRHEIIVVTAPLPEKPPTNCCTLN